MAGRLEGKKVIVAGGSRGIGRGVVLGLLAEGAHVLFTYVGNVDAANETEAEGRKISRFVRGLQADISRPEDMRRVFDYVPQNFKGRPDIYIAAAFPRSVFMPTSAMTPEGFDSMFAAVRGHYFALQQAALNLSPGGRVLVFSSGATDSPQPASGAYAGAKAAIERFALSLAKEAGQQGITVNVISPGVTQTDGLVAPPAMIEMLVQQTPLGRLGTVDDVAQAAVELCTPAMGWVNGQIIRVNGGLL